MSMRSNLEATGNMKQTDRALLCFKGFHKWFVEGKTYPVFSFEDADHPECHFIFDANDMPFILGTKDHLELQPDGSFNVIRQGQVWAAFTEEKKEKK